MVTFHSYVKLPEGSYLVGSWEIKHGCEILDSCRWLNDFSQLLASMFEIFQPRVLLEGMSWNWLLITLKTPNETHGFLLETTYTWDRRRWGCLILMIFIEGSCWTSNKYVDIDDTWWYPLVNIQKTMEITMLCSWVNQLFLWPCSIANCLFTWG